MFFDRARRSHSDIDLSSNHSQRTDDEDFSLPNDEQTTAEEVIENVQEIWLMRNTSHLLHLGFRQTTQEYTFARKLQIML